MLGRAHRTAAAVLGDSGSGQKHVPTATRVSRPHVFLAAQVVALIAMLLALTIVSRAQAVTLPSGFSERIVFTGLTQPTAVRFSPDGRVFVAEKRGVIKSSTA